MLESQFIGVRICNVADQERLFVAVNHKVPHAAIRERQLVLFIQHQLGDVLLRQRHRWKRGQAFLRNGQHGLGQINARDR